MNYSKTLEIAAVNRIIDISELNDSFRQSGFGVNVTTGVQDLPDLEGLFEAVRNFNKFTEDNDPYGEHDFGSLIWYGETVFWKIDYYDQALRFWEEPTSSRCKRVLTIMLADEY